MVCIYCSSPTKVTNSRLQKKNNSTWRRRECTECSAIYTSIESVDYQKSIMVRSENNLLTPFSKDKLLICLYECLKHRKTSIDDSTALNITIINKLITLDKSAEIKTKSIKKITLETLSRFDKAAAVHYEAYFINN